MKKIIPTLMLSLSVGSQTHAALADVAGIWHFENSLDEASGGTALTANGFNPAYTTAMIEGEEANVLDLPALFPEETLVLNNGAGANGGPAAAFTNNWTIVMDLNLETISTFQSLLQTDPGNGNDVDIFVRPNGGLDIGPNPDVTDNNRFVGDQWYRLAITCGNNGNGGAQTLTAYIDGAQTEAGGIPASRTSGFDGGMALDTVVNLFSDESSETDDTLVNSLAFWGEALSASEVAALGGPTAGGIVIPDNPSLCPENLACSASIDPDTVVLTWTAAANLDATGLEVLRDDVVIATLPVTDVTYTDSPSLPAMPGYTDFVYTLRVVGPDAATCPVLACTANFFNGEPGDDSVLHLTLDANGDDISGLENDATINGAVTFENGRISNAASFDELGDPIQSISIESADSLQFGADVDFTVSVWVNDNGAAFTTDHAIFSSKDWGSGNNPGWIIATNPDGRWQWNMGSGATRRDFDEASATLVDGNWHHLLVSHDRDGDAVAYLDGSEVGRVNIAGFGDLNNDLPIAVGTDSTLNYASFPGLIDDAIIWRRVVSPAEVAGIHNLGLNDTTVSHEGPPKICPATLSGSLTSDNPFTVELNWSAAQNLDSTNLEVLLGDEVIATLAPTAATYTHMPTVAADSDIELAYTVRMTGGNDSADCAPITTTVSFYSGQLTDGIVLYLPLNNDANDFSGNANDGTISGEPAFGEGQIGNAATFDDLTDPHQYLEIGTSENLNFGAETDFTVSVWVNNLGGFVDNRDAGGSADDPAIISNKDWNSGNNAGWVIAAGPNGRWQWNIGDGGGRADYDGPANQINDGLWHHLCVVHDRDDLASLYYDGNLVTTRDISGIGDLTSGLPTAVATDGTLGTVWANWFPGSIDEVAIWSRALSGSEVGDIFTSGSNGSPLLDSNGDPRITKIERNPATGQITLTFEGPANSDLGLDGSDDLMIWSEISDNVVSDGEGSIYQFTDPDAAGKRRRFYRLRTAE